MCHRRGRKDLVTGQSIRIVLVPPPVPHQYHNEGSHRILGFPAHESDVYTILQSVASSIMSKETVHNLN